MSTRVVIADDQPMIRAGLRSLLEGAGDVEVVAEAPDGELAVAAVRRYRPDVVLMDIRMPVIDGLAAPRRLVAEDAGTRVLVLTTFDLDQYVFEALRAGASGFLLKDAGAEELVAAVQVIAAGEAVLAPAVTRRVIEAFGAAPRPDPAASGRPDQLSAREREVLLLLARGRSNAEIARELLVSEATAKTQSATCWPSCSCATASRR